MGWPPSFPFPSPGREEKRVKEFHFGTPALHFALELAAAGGIAASCQLLRRAATLQNCRLSFDVTRAVICGLHFGILRDLPLQTREL